VSEEISKMQKHVLVLMTSAVVLACDAIAASAQQIPDVPAIQQQPQILQQRQERQLRGAQTPRRGIEDDLEEDGGMAGWRYGWRHQQDWGRGAMGPGMMGRGGMMGPGSMGHGMMMRMLFAMMDSDGDGTISLQEFQAAHERIFRAMDANKDGHLTLEEIQTFMHGPRRSVPRQ
jgi:EF hand